MNKKNLEPRKGWENRNVTPLPTEKCIIFVIKNDADGEHVFLCRWEPYKPEPNYSGYRADGYIGTAEIIGLKYQGIGFHVWNQNNDEFIYYKLVEYPKL